MIEILFFSCIVMPFIIFQGLHTVKEGHVAIYFRGGAVIDTYAEPGWQVKLPFVTSYEEVKVTVKTTKVENVPCNTAGGLLINFDSIDVVNRLDKDLALDTVKLYSVNYEQTWINDKIHHEINQFCSKRTLQQVYIDEFDKLDSILLDSLNKELKMWAPGIVVVNIRLTKPQIPDQLLKNYEKLEIEKTQLQIVEQEQRVELQIAETAMITSKIRAESDAQIAEIELKRHLLAKAADKEISDIDNQIYFSTEQSRADANLYKKMMIIEAEQAQLTPDTQTKNVQIFTFKHDAVDWHIDSYFYF